MVESWISVYPPTVACGHHRQLLHEPASHPRDIRSELLVKLALLDRAGGDSRDLLRVQRGQLAPVAAALADQVRTAAGYDRVLAVWRLESVSGTLRFLDSLLATVPAQRAGTVRA